VATTECKWYTDAWVGRLKKLGAFERIEDDLPWELGFNVVPKYIGDDMIILLGLSDSKAKEIIMEESQHGTSLFPMLEKWNSTMRPGHRLVWAQCWGVPLEKWDIANIRKIVATVRDLIEVDDDVDERRRLDRARILIRTPRKPLVHHTVAVHIGGEVHNVHIVEEGCTAVGMRSTLCRSTTNSSEQIDSDGSDIGTLFAAPETTPDFQTQTSSLDGMQNDVAENHQISLLPGGHQATENSLGIAQSSQTHPPSTDKRTQTDTGKGKQQNSVVQTTVNTMPYIGEDRTCEAAKKKGLGSRVMSSVTEERTGYTGKEIVVVPTQGQRDIDHQITNGPIMFSKMTCISNPRDNGPVSELGLTTHTTSFTSHNPYVSPPHLETLSVHPSTSTAACDKLITEAGSKTDVSLTKHNTVTNPEHNKASSSYQTEENGSELKVYARSRGRRQKTAHQSGKQHTLGDITPLTHLEPISGTATPTAATKHNIVTNPKLNKASSSYQTAEIGSELEVYDRSRGCRQKEAHLSGNQYNVGDITKPHLLIWNLYRAQLHQQQQLNTT